MTVTMNSQMIGDTPHSNTQLDKDINGSQLKCQNGGGRYSFQLVDGNLPVTATVTSSDGQCKGERGISRNEECANIAVSHTAPNTNNNQCSLSVSNVISEAGVDRQIVGCNGSPYVNKIQSDSTDIQKANVQVSSGTRVIDWDTVQSQPSFQDNDGKANDVDKTCESPKSPSGSRRNLSLSKLISSTTMADPSLSL
jgi:hypothetical protein